jgi:hypothetical protein
MASGNPGSSRLFRPQMTIAVILGMQSCPREPSILPSTHFAHSAEAFFNYLVDPGGLGLRSESVLNRFQ